jgi:hypothetical protein
MGPLWLICHAIWILACIILYISALSADSISALSVVSIGHFIFILSDTTELDHCYGKPA